MKTRGPYNVTDLIRLYNIFQVIACTIYVTRAHSVGFSFQFLWKCEKFDWVSDLGRIEVKIGYWLFLLLRIFEFTETIFFVLRKKQKQASFLHIFHHIGSVLMTWLFIVSDAGKIQSCPCFKCLANSCIVLELMAVYIAIINSYVHISMYTYYFFSSFTHEKIQKFIKRVKPIITIIQLIQFVIIIGHCVVAVLPKCNAGYFFHLQIINFIVLTFLFGNFFIQSYLKNDDEQVKGKYQMAQT